MDKRSAKGGRMSRGIPEQALDIDDGTEGVDALEALARKGDRDGFLHALNQINWSLAPHAGLGRALDLALGLDLAAQASELARLGTARFPNDPRLAQAARVLAPPVVRALQRGHVGDLHTSQDWLRDHAEAYRGQWVVVREGQLLGSAPALADLRELLARENNPSTTIVTRVG